MRRNIIIFDVDKTIFTGNLHEFLIEDWSARGRLNAMVGLLVGAIARMLPHRWLRRRFEYFLVAFMSEDMIHAKTTRFLMDGKKTNIRLVKRIIRYQQHHFEVALITAAPHRVVSGLARELNVSVYASRAVLGLITVDLLAKKSRVYRLIETTNCRIRTIYSDSPLDFWPSAKNFLVTGNKLELITL
jgi:phosphoserine phosphatase